MSTRGKENAAAGSSTTNIKWFLQASSGLFLIFFMAVHLYVAHINGGSPIELFNSVVQNLTNPWWLAFFLAFVWIITYHALNGVKGIVYDMGVSASKRKYVTYGFTALYIITVIYGSVLAVIVANLS